MYSLRTCVMLHLLPGAGDSRWRSLDTRKFGLVCTSLLWSESPEPGQWGAGLGWSSCLVFSVSSLNYVCRVSSENEICLRLDHTSLTGVQTNWFIMNLLGNKEKSVSQHLPPELSQPACTVSVKYFYSWWRWLWEWKPFNHTLSMKNVSSKFIKVHCRSCHRVLSEEIVLSAQCCYSSSYKLIWFFINSSVFSYFFVGCLLFVIYSRSIIILVLVIWQLRPIHSCLSRVCHF